VAKARESLGSSGARIEIRLLPPGAAMPAPARHKATPTRHKAARARSAAALPPDATPRPHRGAAP
jgi:hypothetical protein